jgi:hypothetical protein
MNLLSQIIIKRLPGNCFIQLLQGDLSEITAEHATDILVMSAFPGNYIALPGSLIKALEDKGLSVESLANDKETDLRKQLNCWLSKPLSTADQQKFNFKRILCFEPGEKIKEPDETVGDIFRCINTFAFEEENNVLSMPIIATGYQQVPLQKILPALMEASMFWLNNGLPLRTINLVVHNPRKAEIALPIFEKYKSNMEDLKPQPGRTRGQVGSTPSFWDKIKDFFSRIQPVIAPIVPSVKPAPANEYDYFISYAHVHSKEIALFVETLKKMNNTLNIFYDKETIPPGGLWLKQISMAIQQADKVLVFLSPDYDNSPVCWDEFQCAKLVEYNRKKSIIQTVYLYGYKETEMPPIMGIYSYIDCREGSTEKLEACVQQLLK